MRFDADDFGVFDKGVMFLSGEMGHPTLRIVLYILSGKVRHLFISL